MAEIYIFSGTTEGRELSEFLCEQKIAHTVFVATEYGKIVMQDSPYAKVQQGRMTKEDMQALFAARRPDLVLDATHPYAVEVSENIRSALNGSGRYIRIARSLQDSDRLLAEASRQIKVTEVRSTEEAVACLKKTKGICLLTTGVKTLKEYTADEELKERLAVRILPSPQSLAMALEAGLKPAQIAALEGPFTSDFNEAMIDLFHADILVTKNSGSRGGFAEKVRACVHRKTELLVIQPEDAARSEKSTEPGQEVMTLLQAKSLFAGPGQQLTIVGIGVGDEKSLTLEACRRIREADLLIGAGRMLETAARINPQAERVREYTKDAVLKRVREYGCEKNVFLVSGDTGFYSAAFGQSAAPADISVEILPGISSISYLCAGLGIPYSDKLLLSSHGRKLDVRALAARKESFFAITSGRDDFNEIIGTVIVVWEKEGRPEPLTICEGYNLGLPDQRIRQYTPEEFAPSTEEGLYIAGVIYGTI